MHVRLSSALVVAAGVLAAGAASRAGWAHGWRGQAADWNVVLITLDTTRADRLGPYGFAGAATANIDQLARDGVVFEQAESAAPLTLPAHTTIFTGRLPPQHGVRDNGAILAAPERTLAQVLYARGFRTAGFPASYVLDARWGLDRGFDLYDGHFEYRGEGQPDGMRRSADQIVDRALAWLDRNSEMRFFAWLHFYDAHTPYVAQPRRGASYQDEIAFIDSQIGRLLVFLEERHLRDRTLLVIVGDHGESLGEHGERTHGLFVYEAVTRVPFIVSAPSTRLRGRRVADVVRSVDVMPTVLDLLQIPIPSNVYGVSLRAQMAGTPVAPQLDAYSETIYPHEHYGWSPLRAYRAGRFKLIEAPRPELYDLDADPGERHNLYEARGVLAAALERHLAGNEFSRGPSVATTPDHETAAALASLGYASGSSREARPTLLDPKDEIGLYQLITGDATRARPRNR